MKLTPPIFLYVETIQLQEALPSTDSCLGDNCEADLPTPHPYALAPVQPMTGLYRLPQS